MRLPRRTQADTPNPLAGAVFGLYSLSESEKLPEGIINSFRAEYGLDNAEASFEHESKAYYLSSIVVSPESGKIDWTGLGADQYIVKELKAPDGYRMDRNIHLFTYNGKKQTMTITNEAGLELPGTGGSGLMTLVRLLGACMLLAGAMGYIAIHRRKMF